LIAQLNVKSLINFFSCDGESIILGVRDRYGYNTEINSLVSLIEQRYIPLELDEVECYQQSLLAQQNSMGQQALNN